MVQQWGLQNSIRMTLLSQLLACLIPMICRAQSAQPSKDKQRFYPELKDSTSYCDVPNKTETLKSVRQQSSFSLATFLDGQIIELKRTILIGICKQ